MSIAQTHRRATAVAALALTGALVLAAPLAASAHVHVEPVTADAGAASVDLTFSVPNESPTASTTKVEIALPSEAGFTTVEPTEVRGWRTKVIGPEDAPTAVRFVADGDGIGDGQTQRLLVRVGPVPDVGSLPIPVSQTYSDDTVVEWDEATPASGEEPEHPAPTLYVNDAPPSEDEHGAAAAGGEQDDEQPAAAPAAAVRDDTGTAAVALATAALLVGVIAVVLAALALVRSRRRTASGRA